MAVATLKVCIVGHFWNLLFNYLHIGTLNCLQAGKILCYGGERTSSHQFVDDEQIVKADETVDFKFLDLSIWKKFLLIGGRFVDGDVGEIDRKERRVVILLAFSCQYPVSLIHSFLSLHKVMIEEFIDRHHCIENNSSCICMLFQMLYEFSEEKVGHLFIAMS